MTELRGTSTIVKGKDVAIETYIDGQRPCLVILPSYGRDGGGDYDNITGQRTANGWQVVRPQPRGIAGSTARWFTQQDAPAGCLVASAAASGSVKSA